MISILGLKHLRSGYGLGITFILLVLITANTTEQYTQSVLLGVAVFVILAISLDLAAGMAGLYSLGHAALFGFGAYINAVLATHLGLSVFILLPISVFGTALVGVLVGVLSLRVSGLYFAITTFVLSLLSTVVINRLPITGSYAGLIGPNFPDFPSSLAWLGNSLVWCGGIAVIFTVFIAQSLRFSPSYKALLAVRDSEPLASSAGINPGVTRVAIFGLSSSLAGLAGWLFAFLGVVSPGQFDWTISVNILVMVILGGINTTAGPIIGAIFVNLFTSYVNISPLLRQSIFGSLFILTIVFMPTGFVGLTDSLVRHFRKKNVTADNHAASTAQDHVLDSEPIPLINFREKKMAAVNSNGVAIDCKNLHFRFTNGSYAVNDIDFRVKFGSIHGLIGPNGSGKSTLLNLISGHLKPESGSILIAGHSMVGRSTGMRAKVGLRRTFQAATLVGELDITSNPVVALCSSIGGLGVRSTYWLGAPSRKKTDRSIHGACQAALRDLGVESMWDHVLVKDAPHGIKQLVQLAVATVAKPSILILDEPVAGLSDLEVNEMGKVLMEMRDKGVTIVIVEHHTSFLFAICDEVTVLDAGSLLTTGSPNEIRAHRDVQKVYLGS